uniref:Uncharacterized protein n=1 Tax=Ascaris lumbricoides TaxID=6252 RepID=A0A0M3IWG5_ASCLU
MWLVLVMCASFAATQYVTRTVEQKLPPGFQPSFGKRRTMNCSNKRWHFYPNFAADGITCFERSRCFPIFVWMQQGGILPADLIKSFFDQGNSSNVICALHSVELNYEMEEEVNIFRWYLECSDSPSMQRKHNFSSHICQLEMRRFKRGAINLDKLIPILDFQRHQNSLTNHQKRASENEEDNAAMIPPYRYKRFSPKDNAIRYLVTVTTLIVAVCFAFIVTLQFCCSRNKVSCHMCMPSINLSSSLMVPTLFTNFPSTSYVFIKAAKLSDLITNLDRRQIHYGTMRRFAEINRSMSDNNT